MNTDRLRIIPALAGNTADFETTTKAEEDHPRSRGNTLAKKGEDPKKADHPRSRGEYVCGGRPPPHMYGSSPLSRGIPVQADV